MNFLKPNFFRGSTSLNGQDNKNAIILRALLLSCLLFLFANSCTSDTNKLINAAGNGNISKVEKLLSKGTDINAKDEKGRRALILASEEGYADIVKMLLDKGADVNVKDKRYFSVVRAIPRVYEGTALSYASVNGNVDIVKMLIDNGADVNAKDEEGKTVLIEVSSYYASHISRKMIADIVKILIDNGADVNAKDEDGRTALFYASGEHDIVQLLKNAGAKE